MSLFQIRDSLHNLYSNLKTGKLLLLFATLSILTSACYPRKNATLLYQDNSFPASNLVWSPAGNELAILTVLGNPPKSAIYILNIETRKLHLVADHDFADGYSLLGWTTDGTQLLFQAYTSTYEWYVIWLADPNGIQPPKPFLNGEIRVLTRIGQMVISGGNHGNVVFDANTKNAQNYWDASLSPDGKMVVYRKEDPTSPPRTDSLHIINSDGSCDLEVPGHFEVFSPAWSPDGKQIAYIGQSDQGIYLLDLAKIFGEDIVDKGLPCP